MHPRLDPSSYSAYPSLLTTFGILDVSDGGFVPIFCEPVGKLLIGLARQAPQLVGIGFQEHPFGLFQCRSPTGVSPQMSL
jgi:hypothetical protein